MQRIFRFSILLSLVPQAGAPDSRPRQPLWLKRAFLTVYVLTIVAMVGGLAYSAAVKYIEDSTVKTQISIPAGAEGVAPGSPLWFDVATTGNELTGITLYQSHRSANPVDDAAPGQWSEESVVPMTVDKQKPSGTHKIARVNLTNESGGSLLSIDSHYRLVIEGKRLQLKLPWPEWQTTRDEFSFRTLLSPLPEKLQKAYTATAGEPISLHWTEPVASLKVQTEDGITVDCSIDAKDNKVTHLLPHDYEQGASYKVTIVEAVGTNGVALQEPRSFVINTPDPVWIAAIAPEDGAWMLDPDEQIVISFTEPIRDQEAAEQAFSTEPAVPGTFQWSDDGQTVTFTANEGLPWGTEVYVNMTGSPKIRGTSGGFLGDSAAWAFVVRPNQTIDVNLSRQVLTAYEGDAAVMTMLTATGVAGGETPTGTFMVQDKLVSCRMAGRNPSGSYYDIPNVPWVMPFWGDYTIHGAPWRARFGVPGSAGCVSLTTWDAQRLWQWAQVGARIVIHY